MRDRHAAARVEDRINLVVAGYLRRRGWVPRVVAYSGYGGPGWVRVLGRVLAVRPPRPGERPQPDPADLAEWVAPLDREQLRTVAVTALRGWRSFVNVPMAGTAVDVRVGDRTHRVVSERGGYLDVRLPSDLGPGTHEVRLAVADRDATDGEAADIPDDRDPVTAAVVVVGEDERFGVVSDIDDTVMITSLPRPFIAFWNTFVLHEQARRPVPGMAELLTAAAQEHPGSPVVYLSTGAWNVAPTLARFMARHGFPPGPLLLTDWGPTNTGWFRSGQEHKRSALRRLRQELPQVRWLLVGDDGQHDPEIYREFAQEHPDAVRAVVIRQLTPAEQVLAHGLPVPVPAPLPAAARSLAEVPHLEAPDGDGLLHQLSRAGLL